MADAFTIRSAAPSDHASACALFDQVDELHSAHQPWRFRTPPSPPRSTSYFEALVNDADSTVLVADAGTVVGIATLEIKRAPEAARGFYEAVGYAPLLTRLRNPLGSGSVAS